MDEQLSLLGDAAAEKTVRVAPTPRVLLYGVNAPGVPRHRDAGALGSASAMTVRLMLELAEDALRYNQAPDPRLVVPEKRLSRGKPVFDKAGNVLALVRGDKGQLSPMRLDKAGAQAAAASNMPRSQ